MGADMPQLTITHPTNDAHVPPLQAFQVNGRATDVGPPERHDIDSVTVQVDGGPAVDAQLVTVPDKTLSIVDYTAAVEVTSGTDPHTITVVAINDNQISVKKQIEVFTGPIFHAAPPAVLVEILSPVPFDLSDVRLTRLVSRIQYALIPAADQLAAIGKVVAGPNLALGDAPQGLSRLRMGIWVQDQGFPVMPPLPPTFPLPRLNPPGAEAGFALAEELPVPLTFGASYAVSLPTSTLQSLVDAIFPQVKNAVDGTFDTLNSIRAGTVPPDTVVTTVHADVVEIPVKAAFIERLGAPLNPDFDQHLPAVVSHDSVVDVGDALDWLLVTLLPSFGVALLALTGLGSVVASDASNQIHGVASGIVAALPPRLPVRNTDIGVPQRFPTLVPDWQSFGTTENGILGTGTVSVHDRDQSEVAISIHGSGRLEGYQSDFSGGAGHRYGIDLANLAPDAGRFTWHVTGFAEESGSVAPTAFGLGGTADVVFPLPLHVVPGIYDFVLTVTATETCGTDPHQVLTATAARPVQVKVKKDPIIPP
jgi:hypothetical protein